MLPEEDIRRQGISLICLIAGLTVGNDLLVPLLKFLKTNSLPVWGQILVNVLPVQCLFLASAVLPSWKFLRKETFSRLFDLKKISSDEFLHAVFSGISLCIFSMIVTLSWTFFLHLLGIPVREQELIRLLSEQGTAPVFCVILITGGLIAPFCEELVFRYAAVKVLEKHFPFPGAALTGAVFFAVIHWNIQALPALTMLGFALSCLYRKSGSLLSAMTAHCVFNTATILIFLGKKLFF